MPETLLRTKLHIPPLRPNLVPRPQLIERLNQGLQPGHKLTLISAPAGFGKTTLVSEWMARLRSDSANRSQIANKVAWLSLDEGDNDPRRFLAYLVAALIRVDGQEPSNGSGALGILQSSRPPPAEDILTTVINEIAANPDRIILVLDDYHLIDSPPVDDTLIFLLEHLPPQMHLLIATRDDPQLPFARLRALGQLIEVRASDLRFSSPEAALFLTQVMGLDLSAEDIALLETRTEGWIAGLRLAAISMQGHKEQGHQDVTAFVKSFTGSHRFILDYLIEEVLEQQPESIQKFLLQTAVLDQMTGPLCDALTGERNGQATLEMLEQSNLFIIPLDDQRHWYRYHHLFSDLLRQRLRQTQPVQVITLHNQASEWHKQNGFAGGAIEHALHAEDFERAAFLIEENIEDLWGRGEHRKLRRWLGRLPAELLLAKPHISIFQARDQCNIGRLDAAEQTLKTAEEALDAGRNPASDRSQGQMGVSYTQNERMKLRGRIAATRALMCSFQGDVPGIIRHAGQALEFLPQEDLSWRSVTALILGNAHGFKGNMPAAYEARFEALKACEAAGDHFFVMIANLQLAITLREQGQLQRTVEICQRQLAVAHKLGLSQARTVGYLLAIWGETLAELNELDEALDRARDGFKMTGRSEDLQLIGWSFMCLIRILISRRELADAEETIQIMEDYGRKCHLPPWVANQIATWQVRLWLAQDNLDAASQWMEKRGLNRDGALKPSHEIGYFSLFDYLVLGRILIAQGRLDAAAGLLQKLLTAAETGERTSSVIEILMLQALTFQARGAPEKALLALEQALTLAEPEGFVRIFVDEGQPMARLLYAALNRGIAPDYVRRLLAVISSAEPMRAGTTTSQADQSELIEPLSERELEVLQRISEGLTNREIADRLYLSLNTVKVHTRNLYGKLGVHTRTQAVVRARALGILLQT